MEANWIDRRVLVVGGTGFVGSHLVRALIARGAKVCVTSQGSTLPWRLKDIEGSYAHEVLALPDTDSAKSLFENVKPEYIFYVAGALPGHGADAAAYEHANVEGVRDVFENAPHKTLRSFTLMGTASEYGPIDVPTTEIMEEKPEESYGTSKLRATRYAMSAGLKTGTTTTVLRSPATYGPFQGFTTFIPNCILACLEKREFPMSGEQQMDFLYIDDLVSALLLAGQRTAGITAEIINISNGKPDTLADVAYAIADALDAKTYLKVGTLPLRPYERHLR